MLPAVLVLMYFMGANTTNGYPQFEYMAQKQMTIDECYELAKESNSQAAEVKPGLVIAFCVPDLHPEQHINDNGTVSKPDLGV